MKVKLKPTVAEKLKQLTARGVKFSPDALNQLAAADAKDGALLLQALLKRGEVPNPSKFVTASLANLAKKKAAAIATAPILAESSTVQSTPSTPAEAKVARPRPPLGPPPTMLAAVKGQGQQPLRRGNLSFDRRAVQEKLFALNGQGIWAKQGKLFALDESALSALMRIEPARGDPGRGGETGGLVDPSLSILESWLQKKRRFILHREPCIGAPRAAGKKKHSLPAISLPAINHQAHQPINATNPMNPINHLHPSVSATPLPPRGSLVMSAQLWPGAGAVAHHRYQG
eukprot:Skav226005  [mRNA]  locus=scaffold1010:113449:114309:- [translate_table: standard]